MKFSEIEAMSMLWVVGTEEGGAELVQHSDLPEDKKRQLQSILDEFAQLFSEPEGLPPCRDVDHRIPIKSRVDPVNVCPYRYPCWN